MEDDLCFDNLDEFVNDENRRVTYKWLSQTLSIHVNRAKQLLYNFVNKQRNEKENDKLSVTFLLSGILKANGTMVQKVQIVPEEKLESAKTTFSVLTSCHVYSVQKGKLKDPNTLYMTDYELIKQNLLKSNIYSAIRCPAAQLRNGDEMERFAQARAPDKPTPAIKQNGTSSNLSSKPNKPTGIAGMFAAKPKPKPMQDKNAAEKNDDKKSTEDTNLESKPKTKEKAGGGVMSFFAKQSVAKPKDAKKEKTETESSIAQTSSSSCSIASKESPKKSRQNEGRDRKEIVKRGVKHKNGSDDEDSKQKKRRRVKALVESSSEDEEDVEMESPLPSPAPPADPQQQDEDVMLSSSPEMIPPSPEPTEMKTTSSSSTRDEDTCGKVRKRKLVSKAFVNEEGFMVTEKVWEDEWEDAPPEKKPSPVKSKDTAAASGAKSKKNSPPSKKTSPSKQSGKQTSLMSFFKKK